MKHNETRAFGRYGNLTPEKTEKAGIAFTGSERQILKATYSMLNEAAHKLSSHGTGDASALTEELYSYCHRLIGSQDGFAPPAGMVLDYLVSLRKTDQGINVPGIYLSAALNATPMEELVLGDSIDLDMAGYRLGEGKRLILLEDAKVNAAGLYSRGAIINFAGIKYLSECSEGGVHINAGSAYCFADECISGVHINLGEAEIMGFESRGGVNVNSGMSECFGFFQRGGFRVNYGTVNMQIDYNSVLNNTVLNRGQCYQDETRQTALDPQTEDMINRLEYKAMEVEFMKRMDPNSPKLLDRIRSFDFAKFEKEVNSLASGIRNRLNGI